MKTAALLIILGIALLVSPLARARESTFTLFAGAGSHRNVTTLEENGTKAAYDGWASVGEAGFELSFAKYFGLIASAEVSQAELINPKMTETSFERATAVRKAGRLGFTLGSFMLGGGSRTTSITVKRLTSAGAEEEVLTGTEPFAFMGLNFDFHEWIRFSVEAEYGESTFGDTKATSLSGGLKLALLLNLF